jgi:hypothetical protein
MLDPCMQGSGEAACLLCMLGSLFSYILEQADGRTVAERLQVRF